MKTKFNIALITAIAVLIGSLSYCCHPKENKEKTIVKTCDTSVCNHKCHGQKCDSTCQCKDLNKWIPNLTEEQKQKIKDIKETKHKKMIATKAQLDKLEAELKSLVVSNNPDLQVINKKIDEIAKLRTDGFKNRIECAVEVRKLLTDEQKKTFDKNIDMFCVNHPKPSDKHKGGKCGMDDGQRKCNHQND